MKISQEQRREFILNGNIFKVLSILSISTLMMAIVQSLIPFTDGLFLSNIIGPERTGAITFSQPAISIILGMSQGLAVAASAMIGQMAGKGNIEQAKKIMIQIIFFAIFISLAIIPFNLVMAKYMSFRVDKLISNDVYIYISLYSFIIPLQFMAAIFNSIKYSTGNPEAPFYRIVVLLVLKIFFNYIYLYTLKLDIYGTILASFSAYIFTTIWMYYDIFVSNHIYRLKIIEYKFDKNIVKTLIKISISSMLSFMMISLGFLLINLEIAKYGSIVIGAVGIAGTVNNLYFQLPSAISTTVTTMISINIGVNNVEKCKKIFKMSILFVLSISILTLLIIITNIPKITYLFTHREEVLIISNKALIIYSFSIIPYSIFMMCQSVYYALGKNIPPFIMSFLRIWLFRYIFILFTQDVLSYNSVFYGNLFSNVLAVIIFLIYMTKLKWESGIKYE